MILWRHLNNDKSLWVYHPTKEDADKALERMAIEYCPNHSSRRVYYFQRRLERVDVVERIGKASMAKLMNRIERGEEVQWLK